MTRNRMLVELGVGLTMLSVLAVFGRHQISRLPGELMRAGQAIVGAADGRATSGSPSPPQGTQVASAPAAPRAPGATTPSQTVNLQQQDAGASNNASTPEIHATTADPPGPSDPQAVRDSAAAELDALDPLHDQLIEVLEAIHEAQTDVWEKRRAGDDVTMARFTKRHDRRRLEADAAAQAQWRVRGARRGMASVKARLEREIEVAKETLARIRGRQQE